MFGFFKKKRLTYAEDIELAVRNTFNTILEADNLVGAERVFRVASALVSWTLAIRSLRPDLPVEKDGPVLTIAAASESPEKFRAASAAVEQVLAIAREVSNDKYQRAAMLQQFMAPSHFAAEIRRLETEHHEQTQGGATASRPRT